MSRRLAGAAIAVLATLVLAVPAQAGSGKLNAYRVKATAKNLERLALAGFDVTEGRRTKRKIEVYGTAKQIARLSLKSKLRAKLVRDRKGRTTAQRSRTKVRRGLAKQQTRSLKDHGNPTAGASDAAYQVYRKYDAVPRDGHEQYTEMYDRILATHEDITAKRVIGTTEWHRPIIAIQVSDDPTGGDNGKPAVLYNALQHAREWLAGETCKRTLEYFTSQYGKDKQVTRLVNSRQLWFVCVSNPDGYEFTFTEGNRLWRKNLHEQNGIPGIQNGDGVDPNRNFPVSWGLDDEGSSPILASETYRGPGAASEPETQAMLSLWNEVDFAFQKNDHTAAELLLYPQGWQQYTPAADDPIFTALAGDDKNPAIPGFDPDLGAELYITNGDTLDTAYNRKGILAYTPEGSEPVDKTVSGFEYEDVEGQIDQEFRNHLEFSLDLAESADDPANPESHLGNTVRNFYVDSFAVSYGDPQAVQVLAKREIGAVTLNYRINGGPLKTAATAEWSDGQRYYQEPGVAYHRMRGTVTGTQAGDDVEVWFTAAGKKSASFTYHVESDSNRKVLLLAAEDYTGPSPADADGAPNYLDDYQDALEANGIAYDVYDIDAMGRTAPHPLGVLSHYRNGGAVIWFTGDDYLTREPGQVPGTGTSRLALDEVVAVRDYLNEGGKVFLGGKHAGQQYFEGFEFRNYGYPQPNEDNQGKWCDALRDEAADGCIAHTNDFFQYYLGAYLRVEDGGSWTEPTDATFVAGQPYPVRPVEGVGVFGPGPWTPAPQGGDATVGAPTSTLASTSSLLFTEAYDDFSEVAAAWDRAESGPFSPRHGSQYLYSGTADEAYMRLYRTATVPGGSADATLDFSASFDTEQGWDFVFVEVSADGGNTWTTLPDANGHTSQDTGDSCWEDAGWGADLHSRLLDYQTKKGDSCTPSGTTGEWNAATGSSGGWQDWSVDLSAYRGQEIEVAIVYATDWAVQNLGVWLDDVSLFGETALGFEAGEGIGAWSVGSLEGSPNQATWPTGGSTQTFQEGAVIGTKDVRFVDDGIGTDYQTTATRDSVYAGFEPGTLSDADHAAFMEEVLEYFGLLAEDTPAP